MGSTSSKTVEDIVNKASSDVSNSIFENTENKDSSIVENIINQIINIGNINSKNCSLDIGNANISSKLALVSEIDSNMTNAFQSELKTKLTNEVTNNQNIKREMLASLGSADKSTVETNVQSIISNIVDNSISQEQLNSHLLSFNNEIKQNINIKDLDVQCSVKNPETIVKIGTAKISTEAQADFMSKVISESILNNNLTQKLVNQTSNAQSITSTGLASFVTAFGKMLIPLAIVGVLFILAPEVLGISVVKYASDWRLWAVLLLFLTIYIVFSWNKKIWPFHKWYAPKIDKNGLRLQECEEVKAEKGLYKSSNDCLKDINNPKSNYYWNKFWGYNPETKSCSRYPSISNISKDKNGKPQIVKATFNTEEECDNYISNNTYWSPNYVYTNKKAFVDKFGDKTKFLCENAPYSFYDKCEEKTLSPEELAQWPVDKKNSYKLKTECEAEYKPEKQILQYIPNCQTSLDSNNNINYNNSCQYINAYVKGDENKISVGFSAIPYTNEKDICGVV